MASVSRDAKARYAQLSEAEKQALEEEARRQTAVLEGQAFPQDGNEANNARAVLLHQAAQIFKSLGISCVYCLFD